MVSRKSVISLCLLTAFNALYAPQRSWQDFFRDFNPVMKPREKEFLLKQYENFALGRSPALSDAEITTIPIQENCEGLIDIRTTGDNRVSMLPMPPEESRFYAPCFNAGLKTSSLIRFRVYVQLEDMISHLDSLSKFFSYQSGRFDIKVFEALRLLTDYKMFYDHKVEDVKKKKVKRRFRDLGLVRHLKEPNLALLTPDELKEIEQEVSSIIPPFSLIQKSHATGAAVDIRIWDNEVKDFLDLGTFHSFWCEKSVHAPTFSEELTDVQKKNRLFCLMAAYRAGLVNYSHQFWHFSAGDQYAAYGLEPDPAKRCAVYGAIPEYSFKKLHDGQAVPVIE